jgi:serine/threonine protein kinase/tetratricopeptide (TPR) repeat protein
MSDQPSSEMSIFLGAIDKDLPQERAAYLDQVCGSNERLRAGVESLLAAHDRLGTIPPASGIPGPATIAVAPPVTVGPGAVIGAYKLLEQIGEGGMGTVFLAEQTEPVQRKVALKLIKPGMDSRQVIARFEQERQALALMDHPNIAKVLDAGTTGSEPRALVSGWPQPLTNVRGSETPYFVMELVKGVPLTKYCDERRLTPRERLELFIPVCQAVQHAHQKGVIHRDLKPSNVLVALYDRKPVPKVIDFGVAKATGPKLTERTLFTEFGALVGTLEYMSPEQAELNQLDIDTRSDVYSLGVILYELLTGTTPLGHERARDAGLLEALRVIREEETPCPSARLSTAAELPSIAANRGLEPKKLSGLVRGELDWIVMKCLEKDRSRRYETANGLARDLERYLADEPVQACPPSAWYRFRKFARRNKGRLAVAAGLFLAVTIIAATIGWALRDRAARDEEIERAEFARRQTLAVEVRNSLSIARALIQENKLAAARQQLAEARVQLVEDNSALGDLAAQVRAGEVDLDRFQQFRDLMDRGNQALTAPIMATALGGGGAPGGAAALPSASIEDRRHAAAAAFFLQALERYDILGRADWSTYLERGFLGRQQIEEIRRSAYETLLLLANDVRRRQKEHRSGAKLSEKAAARQGLVYLAKAESAHQPTHALYALRAFLRQAVGEDAAAQADQQLADKTRPALALDYHVQGDRAVRAKNLPAALEAFESALGLEPTHYWSLMRLGSSLCELGRGPEDFACAARIFSGCLLKRPDHAHAYACRAIAYNKLARHDKALADASRAIELDPTNADAWSHRGIACYFLLRPDQAVTDISRAIKLEPKLASAWNNRGCTYHKYFAQYDKALADFSKAIELEPGLTEAWLNRGETYLGRCQPEKAVADFSKAIKLEPGRAATWNARGSAYAKLRQWEKVIADCSEAVKLDPKLADAWLIRGRAYGEHYRQYHQAIADLTEAIKVDPQLAAAWLNRGNAYLGLEQPQKALADFTKATEVDAKYAKAWNNRGVVYLKCLAQNEKAVADFSKAIALDQKYASAWLNRGIAYSRLDNPNEAVRDVSRFIELAPNDPQVVLAYLVRARANYRLTRGAQARADYESILQREPLNASALDELAWLLADCPDRKLRDPRQAVKLASKAAQVAPKVGKHWTTLGVAYYRAGDWKNAVGALDRALELRQWGVAINHLFLAMAHWQLRNQDLARKAYDQAIRWLAMNKEMLSKQKSQAEQLRLLRSEAEEVLQLKKK